MDNGRYESDVALNFNSNLGLLNTFYKKMKSKNDQKVREGRNGKVNYNNYDMYVHCGYLKFSYV